MVGPGCSLALGAQYGPSAGSQYCHFSEILFWMQNALWGSRRLSDEPATVTYLEKWCARSNCNVTFTLCNCFNVTSLGCELQKSRDSLWFCLQLCCLFQNWHPRGTLVPRIEWKIVEEMWPLNIDSTAHLVFLMSNKTDTRQIHKAKDMIIANRQAFLRSEYQILSLDIQVRGGCHSFWQWHPWKPHINEWEIFYWDICHVFDNQ